MEHFLSLVDSLLKLKAFQSLHYGKFNAQHLVRGARAFYSGTKVLVIELETLS